MMSPDRSGLHRAYYIGMRIALIVLLGQLLLALPVRAATSTITVAIPSFNNTNIPAFQLNSAAALSGSAIRLTPALETKAGSAFWKNRVSLANQRSFSTYFAMSMTNPGSNGLANIGADGIVFTIQTLSNTAGSTGGGIGYEGITPSVGVEFDTWQNTVDADDNHVGLDVGGSVASVQVVPLTPLSITLQGKTWHAWVDYNGATSNLQVRIGTTSSRSGSILVLNTTRNLASDIGQDVYVGFTSATGGAFEDHDIQSFYFVNDYAPIDITTNTYNQAANAVVAAPNPASIATSKTSIITATVYSISGAPLANQSVTFTTSLGTLSTASGVTNASGQVSVTLNGGSTAGVANIRATAAGGAYGVTSVTVTAPTLYKVFIPVHQIRR